MYHFRFQPNTENLPGWSKVIFFWVFSFTVKMLLKSSHILSKCLDRLLFSSGNVWEWISRLLPTVKCLGRFCSGEVTVRPVCSVREGEWPPYTNTDIRKMSRKINTAIQAHVLTRYEDYYDSILTFILEISLRIRLNCYK